MLSLGLTIYRWAAESASVLLDLANAGRADGNVIMTAIAAALAITRLAALLLVTLPSLAWLYKLLFVKVKREEAGLRGVLIVILVVSVLFELWVSPQRVPATADENADAGITIAQQAEGGDGT